MVLLHWLYSEFFCVVPSSEETSFQPPYMVCISIIITHVHVPIHFRPQCEASIYCLYTMMAGKKVQKRGWSRLKNETITAEKTAPAIVLYNMGYVRL